MKVSILGSTGSVGQNTVKVLQAQDVTYDVRVLTAHSNYERLAEQAIALDAKAVALVNEAHEDALKDLLKETNIEIFIGEAGLAKAAQMPADWFMAAITGMAGLNPLMHAIAQGAKVAIANKEPLVSAGRLVLEAAEQSGATLLPVDSEHNAVFQVYEAANHKAIERIILTASGGPFWNKSLQDLEVVTVKDALNHPNWSMGNKISIDSATMMNKALEVIEAHYLFNMPANQIDVVVHPQSVVHSMIEYSDGSILAQMGASDMCTPITNALGYPKRLNTPGQKLDLKQMKRLDFEDVDNEKFPAIKLAYECIEQGEGACIALNGANEVAVSAFLNHKIAFLDIYKIVLKAVQNRPSADIQTMADVISYDKSLRKLAESYIVSKPVVKTATH